MSSKNKAEWEHYRKSELLALRPLLDTLGYSLCEEQPHISGERYLMHAVTTLSGRKLILLGLEKTSQRRVVIKASRDPAGIHELEHERTCRRVLKDIKFAYSTFKTPEELLFGRYGKHLISVQAYIEQPCPFLARPLEEQFKLALEAFKAQEGVHATTYGHARLIKKTFGSVSSKDYLRAFALFKDCVLERGSTAALLAQAEDFLSEHQETIEQYSGFLTHTDFVPHNIRITDGVIYLLDHSSLRFGNKYEGWARFLNFMTLYNPPLEAALVEYVRANRTPEEALSLQLMRVYRLGEILCYYTRTLEQSEGDLHTLNNARIDFWTEVLEAILHGNPVPPSTVSQYIALRDSLRSEEEKKRQQGLH